MIALLWLRGHWRAVVVACVIAVGLLVVYCHAVPNQVPLKEQATLDSMKATKPRVDSARKQIKDSAVRVVTRIVRDSGAAVKARAEADHYRRVADSALAVARAQHDTTSAAFVAADNATKEADQLRVSNDSLSKRLSEAHATILALTVQVTADSVRQARSDALNARLANDVKTAGRCRVLPFVRCPTRKEVLLTGLALGVAGKTFYDNQRGKR